MVFKKDFIFNYVRACVFSREVLGVGYTNIIALRGQRECGNPWSWSDRWL